MPADCLQLGIGRGACLHHVSFFFCVANIAVVLRMERFADFQTVLFRVSMLTGWVLLASLMFGFSVEPAGMALD